MNVGQLTQYMEHQREENATGSVRQNKHHHHTNFADGPMPRQSQTNHHNNTLCDWSGASSASDALYEETHFLTVAFQSFV